MVEETEVRLAEELAKVFRDYYKATWVEALNLAVVPADLEWRQPRSVYYHPEIREVPAVLPSPPALAPKSSK